MLAILRERMDVQQELLAYKQKIDPLIEEYFDARIKDANDEDEFIAGALRHAKKLALSGGKRIRGAYMYYGHLAAGGRDDQRILQASIGIELVHLFLLVHDDIMDRDPLRHGVETFHSRYSKLALRRFPNSDSAHFGNSVAMLLGDMIGSFGNDVIFRSDYPKDQVFNALVRLQKIVAYTVIGQARDVYMEYSGKASEKDILKMYEYKTGKYTIEGPLHLGASLAGASEDFLRKLSEYAIPLGVAFQIQDDILGVFGDGKRLGKSVGSDIQEGKLTLLVSRALKNGNAAERARLKELLSRGDALTGADIKEFRSLIIETGAFDEVREKAWSYVRQGREALLASKKDIGPRAYDFFDSVAGYLAGRDY